MPEGVEYISEYGWYVAEPFEQHISNGREELVQMDYG
jgi:hypothetical protein